MTYLEEYHQLIEKGEVIVGFWIRKEVENLIQEMHDSRYIYDTTEANKRIRFMEHCCLQSKAPYYKKPIKLMPWQKAYFEALYSFKFAETGLKRFNETLLLIARKNGKSTMMASDGMYDLFMGQGLDICCASNDDKQAKYIWKEIEGMRSRLDTKKALTGHNLSEIYNKHSSNSVVRMSARTQNKDGANFCKTYLDESHDIAEEGGGSEIADACWRAMSTHDEQLFQNCTTNGYNRGCYLDKKIDKAKKSILGERRIETLLAFLFLQDSENEIWQDESSWEKSNPSLRYGVKKIKILRENVENARYDKAERIKCLTKDFNEAQDSSQSWLMLEDYDYIQEPWTLEQFRGCYCLGSVDLSATTDMTSAKIMIIKDGVKYIYGQYFIPEVKLEKSDDTEAGAEYKEWARQGLLTIHEGTEVSPTRVAEWFYSLYKDYGLKIVKIGYDQRFAKDFLSQIDEYGIETELLMQGRYLSLAMKTTEAELKAHNINYNSNMMDKWCLRNCCCTVDNLENIMPSKQHGHPSKRIDGALTFIMLMEIYRRYRKQFLTIAGEEK